MMSRGTCAVYSRHTPFDAAKVRKIYDLHIAPRKENIKRAGKAMVPPQYRERRHQVMYVLSYCILLLIQNA